MQAVSIAGLVLAFSTLSQCAFNQTFLPDIQIPDAILSIDIPDRLRNILETKNKDVLKEIKDELLPSKSSFYIKQNLIDYLTDYLISKENGTATRKKRQADLNIPIPTSLSFYTGRGDEAPDGCERDEVAFPDGDCHQILSEGPCDETEFVLIDPITRLGYCAPRLCAPDRVFVFSDQLCHDPLEKGICPPGRQLFTSSYGTPICGCSDGQYEEDDDIDDDVCQPILDDLDDCPTGEVFWFKNFKSPPQCVPDPCKGDNIKKGPRELPFVPSLFDGKCYQLGQGPPVCKPDRFYTVDLETLLGICADLEEGGFTVLSSSELEQFRQLYGDPIPKGSDDTPDFNRKRPSFPSFSSTSIDSNSISSAEKDSFSPKHSSSKRKNSSKRPSLDQSFEKFEGNSNFITGPRFPASSVAIRPPMPVMGSSVVPSVAKAGSKSAAILIGQPVVRNSDSSGSSEEPSQFESLVPTHMTAFSPSSIFSVLQGNSLSHRSKRSPLPYASTSTVSQPGLNSCKAGDARDVNFKCRNKITPSNIPNSRPRRRVPPRPPTPSCNGGNVYGISRSCTGSTRAASSIVASRLG